MAEGRRYHYRNSPPSWGAKSCTGEPGVFEICEGTGFFSTLGPFPLVKVKILGITVNL